jgi:hypothetical protein
MDGCGSGQEPRVVVWTVVTVRAVAVPATGAFVPTVEAARVPVTALLVAAVAVVAAVTAGVAAMTPTPAATPRRLAPAATVRERQERFHELRVDRCICMVPMIGVAGESDVRRG